MKLSDSAEPVKAKQNLTWHDQEDWKRVANASCDAWLADVPFSVLLCLISCQSYDSGRMKLRIKATTTQKYYNIKLLKDL